MSGARFELFSRGGVHVLRCEPAAAPPGRYFLRYQCRHGFQWLLGHAVVDEFATVSSPLIFGPRAALGRLYNAGITLGHRRDAEMGIDIGWPPFCIGVDSGVPARGTDWEASVSALLEDTAATAEPGAGISFVTAASDDWRVDSWDFYAQAHVIATTAPLLPEQLQRLCDMAAGDLVIAVATGNRLEYRPGTPAAVQALSEQDFRRLCHVAGQLAMQT